MYGLKLALIIIGVIGIGIITIDDVYGMNVHDFHTSFHHSFNFFNMYNQIEPAEEEPEQTDFINPVMTRNGAALIGIRIGSVFVDPHGATCTDDVDGNIIPTFTFWSSDNSGKTLIDVIDTSIGSTSIRDSQSMLYHCEDAAGNSAPDIIRYLWVY